MPGASLWLLPPPGALSTALQTLISTTLPPRIPGPVPDFEPHVTITSSIPLSSNISSVLASLPLPASPPKIQFKRLRYGTAFWTKITLELHKTSSLKDLAVACRTGFSEDYDEQKARDWVEKYTTPAESGQEGFIPHLSLVYWDGDVKSEGCREVRLGVGSDVADAGVRCEEGERETVGEWEGWVGGKLVLVDTTKEVGEWKRSIIAERQL